LVLTRDEFRRLDAVGLAAVVRSGEVSPREVADIALDLAAAQKTPVNALTAVFEDGAIDRQIASLDPGAPLAGVPMMIKDIGIFYAGTDNFNGGGDFLRTTAPFDSTITTRYRQAGLVVCGKTTTCELALNVVTESRAFGPTRNPHDPSRGVGGSSGGAGAVVAAGIVPVAHGSDNGGSIRIPASSCGVYGLKPSRGIVPTGPAAGIGRDVSEGWSVTNCNHVLTRSVRDSALLLDIESGGDPRAPGSYADALSQEPRTLTVGVLTEAPGGTPIAPVCVERTLETAKHLESLGWAVEPARFTLDLGRMLRALRIVAGASLWYALAERARFVGRPRREGDVETISALWAEEGRLHTAAELVEATEILGAVARDFNGFAERYDVLLTPTLAEPPLPIGACSQMGDDLEAYLLSVYSNVPFLPLFNSSGGPAASLPLWMDRGLPIGIQVGARPGMDRLILAVSALLEREMGFTPIADRWLDAAGPC
jgi:Asp-tRNA(Asn)/Glu-tRNA(Gln) amidotransferase A subunit family amidase